MKVACYTETRLPTDWSVGTVPAPETNGTFDTATEASVRAVQELAGLEVTGKVNSVTWDAISELYNAIASGNIVQPDQYPGYIID